MNILIIEDERKAAARLSELLLSIDDSITIVGRIESIEAGLDWFATHPMPELICSDIELADGVSFELYHAVKITCPTIFCTAYDQYMIEAFETNAVSYILKPYSREQIERALEKYHDMRQAFASTGSKLPQGIEALLKHLDQGAAKSYKSTLIINHGERIIPLPAEQIAFIYATSSGMIITTTKNQEYLHNATLDEMEQTLDPAQFYRANRQFIIARTAIAAIERYFNRKLALRLNHKTPEPILISRLKAKAFLEWVEG